MICVDKYFRKDDLEGVENWGGVGLREFGVFFINLYDRCFLRFMKVSIFFVII